jgi:putative nucleotidyltransferase with HDIG domain
VTVPVKHSVKNDGYYLDRLKEEVKNVLGEETSHGFRHAVRTMDLAQRICETEGGDPNIVSAAALLHDIGRENIFSDPDHGRRGAEIAREILSQLGAPWDVEAIISLIRRHDDPTDGTDGPIELVILKDADKLELLRVSPLYVDLNRLVLNTSLRLVPYALGLHRRDDETWREEAREVQKKAREIVEEREAVGR